MGGFIYLKEKTAGAAKAGRFFVEKQNGGLYQGRFGAIRENVREKEKPPQCNPNF